MDQFRKLAIEESVGKLFREKYFSICTLDKIIELSGVTPNHAIYRELSAFHCKNYSEMTTELRKLIEQKVVECLRGDPVFNPARVLHMLTDEGGDFAFTEDRYLDGPGR